MIITSWLASILSRVFYRNLVLFRRIHALAKGGDWVAIGVILLATGLSAQSRANLRSGYVGSKTCGGCHANISKKQELSNHALSLRTPGDIGELYGSLPFQFQDRSSQAILTLRKNAGNQLELEASKGVQRESLTLRWAFGSGVRGITPVGVRSDATFVESRLSWYPSEHAYSLTPGATRYDPKTTIESLGRALSLDDVQQCFSCHTTDYTPGPSGPVPNEMGIHCERCHGPGLEHVRLMAGPSPLANGQDRKILNPARLRAFAQVEMCGACHGKPPRETDLSALQLSEPTPQMARYPSRRLVLSRCFSESADGLKCTSCHNPHINVSEWRAQRDQPCIACHSERLRAKARICPLQQSDCVSCHMPKERAMLHFEFTDHWILVAWVKPPKNSK